MNIQTPIAIVVAAASLITANIAVAKDADDYRSELKIVAEKCLSKAEADEHDYYRINMAYGVARREVGLDNMRDVLEGPALECMRRVKNPDYIWDHEQQKYVTPDESEAAAEAKAERIAAETLERHINMNFLAEKQELAARVYQACQKLSFKEAYTNELCVESFRVNGLPDWEAPFPVE